MKLSVGPPYFNSAAGPIALVAGRGHGGRAAAALAARPAARARRGRIALPVAAQRASRCSLVAARARRSRIAALARPRARAGRRRRPASRRCGAQPAPHAAVHLGHGDRPSRHRGRARRHGLATAPSPRETLVAARAGETRRGRARSASASTASSRSPGRTGRRSRRSSTAQPRRRRVLHARARRRGCSARRRPTTSEAAIPTALDGQLYTVLGERRRAGPLAAAAVVEAVRHPDLAGRRADRVRRLPVADRPAAARAPRRGARRRWHEALADPLGAAGAVRDLPARSFASGLLLRRRQSDIRRRMIGQPVPDFALAAGACRAARAWRAPTCAGGRPQLINIFASWCMPCRAEAPQLAALDAPRRRRSTASPCATAPRTSPRFLAAYGDPFQRDRRRHRPPGPARARLVGRARDLRRRRHGR